jgi:serine/threonine-protein kinase
MQYKGTKKTIGQIAGELGVEALIEGSALREGDRVRINVQVTDGSTAAALWADSFEREYRDILALHSDVARAIAQKVKAALSPEEAAALARTTSVNPEAYECYLRGKECIPSEKERDLRTAIEMFEKAVKLDPGFAQGYAALSSVHSGLLWNGYDRTEQRASLAKSAADKSLQLQPDLPEGHAALGFYYYWCRLDFDRALHEFEMAQRMMPNDMVIFFGMGLMLRRIGRMEEAAAQLTRAFALNPTSSEMAHQAALTFAMMRGLQDAVRYHDIAIKLSPDNPQCYFAKIRTLLRLTGDVAQARDVLESARRLRLEGAPSLRYAEAMLDLYAGSNREGAKRLSSESWEALGRYPRALLQAQLYGQAGQPQLEKGSYESAVRILAAKAQQQPEDATYHSLLGIAYAGLGRKQDAVREGKAGVDLQPISKDSLSGFDRMEALACIYAMVGEHEEAIRLLEYLMSIQGSLGIGALRLDPAWNPLRANPRFQALIHRYGG